MPEIQRETSLSFRVGEKMNTVNNMIIASGVKNA
jgi:hypothetical protein